MKRLNRAVVGGLIVAAIPFAGVAVAQDSPELPPALPYETVEECEANGGVWAFVQCVDEDEFWAHAERQGGAQAPAEQAPAEPAPAPPAPAPQGQPQYTG